MSELPVILASASSARLELLTRLGLKPIIMPADIDETEFKGELPNKVALRLSVAKAEKIAQEIDRGYIIGADTVAAVGRRIMPKAITPEMIEKCLKLYSGRRHKVYTGICIIKKTDKIEVRTRVVETAVKVKRLSLEEIKFYSHSGEGIGKAGGYSIQGIFQSFVPFMNGSFSNIIGLPLFEARNMLTSLNFDNMK